LKAGGGKKITGSKLLEGCRVPDAGLQEGFAGDSEASIEPDAEDAPDDDVPDEDAPAAAAFAA
jgi:hypothetical protein